MELKVKRTAIVQYSLIYLMIIWETTYLYRLYIKPILIVPTLILLAAIVCNGKLRDDRAILMSVYLLFAVIFMRLYQGGVGLETWLRWSALIAITVIAIRVDLENFIVRFLNITYVLAGISIIGWLVTQVNYSLVQKVLPFTFFLGRNIFTGVSAYIHGLFLFSVNEWHITRNLSIFSEPGIYQMLLNSAVFIILFMEKYYDVPKKRLNRMLVVLLLAIATCQSTTGYIGILVIVLGYLFEKNSVQQRKYQILGIILVGLIALILDYSIRGSESLINTVVLEKLFTEDSFAIDLEASTGKYRWGTILICLNSMLSKPLGIGYDNLRVLMLEEEGLVAAQIMCTGAAMGVCTFVVILWWIFKPVLKMNTSIIFKVVYVFLYFNSALAQSSELYGVLIMIPLFLHYMKRQEYYNT